MVDRTRPKEALEEESQEPDYERHAPEALLAAARAVAEAPEILWCDEHRAELLSTDRDSGEQFCWKHDMKFLPSMGPYSACRMVRKFLVPAEEES